jgi:hypothetical protein
VHVKQTFGSIPSLSMGFIRCIWAEVPSKSMLPDACLANIQWGGGYSVQILLSAARGACQANSWLNFTAFYEMMGREWVGVPS